MENIILVILCVLVAMLLALAAYVFFFPKRKNEGINVHVDGNSSVKIIRNEEAMRLDIVYETYEDRKPEYEILPDLVDDTANDALNTGVPSINFWLDVARLNELEQGRREAVVNQLAAMGLIKKEQISSFLYPDDNEPLTSADFPEDEFYYGSHEYQEEAVHDEPVTSLKEKTEAEGFKFNEFNL